MERNLKKKIAKEGYHWESEGFNYGRVIYEDDPPINYYVEVKDE